MKIRFMRGKNIVIEVIVLLPLALLFVLMHLAISSVYAHSPDMDQTGPYSCTLTKTEIDPTHKSDIAPVPNMWEGKQYGDSQTHYGKDEYDWREYFTNTSGAVAQDTKMGFKYEAPPSVIREGDSFQLRVSGQATIAKSDVHSTSISGWYTAEGLRVEFISRTPGGDLSTAAEVGGGLPNPVTASSGTYQFIWPTGSRPSQLVIMEWGTVRMGYGLVTVYRYTCAGGARGQASDGESESPQRPAQLSARLDCGDYLALTPGGFAMSAGCGIFVSGYRTNTAEDVYFSFPTLVDSNGLLQGNIAVNVGNWHENPSTWAENPGEHHTLQWLFAACPVTGVCAAPTAAGTYAIPIVVSQNGAGSVTLRLDVTVSQEKTRGEPAARVSGLQGDWMSKYDLRPDGIPDGSFALAVPGGGRMITYLRLEQVDESGSPLSSGPVWDTEPHANNPGAWLLGVYRADNGQWLSSLNTTLDPFQSTVPADIVLLGTNAYDQSYFQPGQNYMITIQFDNEAFLVQTVYVAIPAAP
jgi:hypothetical protein